jgi:Na+/melibiose symporter-like transporter
MSLIPCAMLLVAAAAMAFYSLHDSRMAKIETELKEQRRSIEA